MRGLRSVVGAGVAVLCLAAAGCGNDPVAAPEKVATPKQYGAAMTLIGKDLHNDFVDWADCMDYGDCSVESAFMASNASIAGLGLDSPSDSHNSETPWMKDAIVYVGAPPPEVRPLLAATRASLVHLEQASACGDVSDGCNDHEIVAIRNAAQVVQRQFLAWKEFGGQYKPVTLPTAFHAESEDDPGSDAGQGNCDSNYDGACVPIVNHDLDCADIDGSVTVIGDDPHGFDRDGDGTGCDLG